MALGDTQSVTGDTRSVTLHTSAEASQEGTKGSYKTRVLVLVRHNLLAEAIATALGSLGGGVEVIGRAGRPGKGVALAALLRPDVILLDEAFHRNGPQRALSSLKTATPESRVVALIHSAGPAPNAPWLASCAAAVSKDACLADLASVLEAVAGGASLGLVEPAERAEAKPALSKRELEVLGLICRGLANKEIARILGLSHHTVHNHVARLFSRLGAHSRLEALSIAAREGLLNLG